MLRNNSYFDIATLGATLGASIQDYLSFDIAAIIKISSIFSFFELMVGAFYI